MAKGRASGQQPQQKRRGMESENNPAEVTPTADRGETREGPMSNTATQERQDTKSRQEDEEVRDQETENQEDEQEEEEGADEAVVSVTDSLLGAVKSITDEIEECDLVIERAKEEYETVVEQTEARKEELQTKLRETIGRVQDAVAKQFAGVLGNGASRRQTQKPKASGGGGGSRGGVNRHGQKSVRALILEYLHRHGEARTSDIRQMLRNLGRDTNPGVELSRMVKDKSIINAERGLYVLPKGSRQ
jgi:hypothetical protein